MSNRSESEKKQAILKALDQLIGAAYLETHHDLKSILKLDAIYDLIREENFYTLRRLQEHLGRRSAAYIRTWVEALLRAREYVDFTSAPEPVIYSVNTYDIRPTRFEHERRPSSTKCSPMAPDGVAPENRRTSKLPAERSNRSSPESSQKN